MAQILIKLPDDLLNDVLAAAEGANQGLDEFVASLLEDALSDDDDEPGEGEEGED
jgi:hypothetical protein